MIDFNVVSTIVVLSVDQSFGALDTFGLKFQGGHPEDRQLDPVIWELGSLSKPITAYLAKMALNDLQLTEDSLVCSVLPQRLCHDDLSKITFRQLLEHRAGLPLITNQMVQAEKDLQDPYAAYSLDHLEIDLLEINPTPGKYGYSHMGYAALFWLFQKVGGLDSLLEKYFPISESNYIFTANHDDLLMPGHGFNGKPTSPWHVDALSPALGLKSDIFSLQAFIRKWFPGGENEYVEPNPELLAELDSLEQKKEFKLIDGWFLFRSGKSIVYYQNGHTGGHSVSVAFIPAESKSVIVFADSEAGTQDLSLHILDMLHRAKKK